MRAERAAVNPSSSASKGKNHQAFLVYQRESYRTNRLNLHTGALAVEIFLLTGVLAQ